MVKRKSRRNSGVHSPRNKDISMQTLTMMVILVLVMTALSAGLYIHALYSGEYVTPKLQGAHTAVIEEKPAASGIVSINIIAPPEDS